MASKLLGGLPLDKIRELVTVLLSSGVPEDQIVAEVSAMIDGLVDWRSVVKGLGGELLEAADGPLATAIVTLIVTAVKLRRK